MREVNVKASVLVLDDNEDLADNIAELFEVAGARVTVCLRTEDALAKLRQHPYDLAILDVKLPGQLEGLDLVPELKKFSPEAEVIVITGNPTLDTAIAAVRHGVFAYVQKPFDPLDLLAVGERAMGQVSLGRERSSLARELARSEAMYRGVVDTVDSLIVGLDADGGVTMANRTAVHTLGSRSSSLQGESFVQRAAVPEARGKLESAVKKAQSGAPVRGLEILVDSVDRGRRRVRWTLKPMSTDVSSGIVLAVGHDVTDRRALELRAAQSEAMAVVGTLTTGLAHEIRNPLNAAKLQLELLLRSASRLADVDARKPVSDRVHIVNSELARLSTMLDEFLSLARPRELARDTISMTSLFAELVGLEILLFDRERIQVEVRPCRVTVVGDRDKLKQVLVNLVANAADAMRVQHGGRIVLGARTLGDEEAEVTVMDSGPGVSEEAVDHLFEPFFTTKEAGTGLGLAIVKRIIGLHGGEISVSRPPKTHGTIVRFTLPRPTGEGGTSNS